MCSRRSAASRRPRRPAASAGSAAGGGAKGAAGVDNGFAKLLKQGIDSVNSTQIKATDLADKFERGVPGVELPQVMLEMQKANVSFRALDRGTQQVRRCVPRNHEHAAVMLSWH